MAGAHSPLLFTSLLLLLTTCQWLACANPLHSHPYGPFAHPPIRPSRIQRRQPDQFTNGDCYGDQTLHNPSGNFSSTMPSSNYSNKVLCRWTIQAQQPFEVVKVTF